MLKASKSRKQIVTLWIFPKKNTNTILRVFWSFFGRIDNTLICFRDLVTFRVEVDKLFRSFFGGIGGRKKIFLRITDLYNSRRKSEERARANLHRSVKLCYSIWALPWHSSVGICLLPLPLDEKNFHARFTDPRAARLSYCKLSYVYQCLT